MAKAIPTLEAQGRDKLGSRYAARLREQGRLPAVLYGRKQETVHLSVAAKELTHLLHENRHVVELIRDGQKEPALIRDVQWDHLGSHLIHVDLTRVDLTEEVTVEVQLEFFGEPAALEEEGAVLMHPEETIEIECLATDIPDTIRVDISNLTTDAPVTVADLKLPPGVKAITDPDTPLATISYQAELPEEEEVAVEGEPEVVGKGKEEEEGEEKE